MRIARVLALLGAAATVWCGPWTTGQVRAQAPNSIRVAIPGTDLGTLDPYRAAATSDVNIVSWMFNGLVRMPPGSADAARIEPDLAASWTSSDDKKTWTFTLRDDVECQAGHGRFTADDALFSLRRAMDRRTSSYAVNYAAVQDVDALDPRTLRITLRDAVPSLLGLLVPYHGGNMLCRRAVEAAGGEATRAPVGTGPFRFAEYRPQQFVRLVAHERYFRGAPVIKEITVRYMQSDSSRELAYMSGEIDMMNGRFEDAWITRMRRVPNTTVGLMGPSELHNLHLNMTSSPLSDLRVRRAIAHAINRDALVRFRGAELSRPATSVIPSGFLGYAAMPLPGHDVAEARRLLAEAGYPQGISVKAIQTTLPAMMTTMEVVQGQLRAAGITLELVPVDHPTFHAQIRQDLSQVVYYGAARFPVADSYLSQFFDSKAIVGTPGAITNFAHCRAADAEITAARTEPDPAKQVALWQEAQRKVVAELCAVPMYEMLQPWAWRSTLDLGAEVSAFLSLAPPITERTRYRE